MNTAIFDLLPSGDVAVELWAPGAVLFSEGEMPHGIHLLYSGQVDLIFAGRNGNARPLRVAEAGQVLGVSGVLSGIKQDCTATARTSCRSGFITGEAFRRALDQNQALWFSVLSMLSHDVGAVYDDMRELAVRQSQPLGSNRPPHFRQRHRSNSGKKTGKRSHRIADAASAGIIDSATAGIMPKYQIANAFRRARPR